MNWRACAAVLTLGTALAGPASAVVYTGIWDPPFGAPFTPDLGWRGTATFSVPDFCEPTGPGAKSISNAVCRDGAVVTSATVELYDADGPGDLLATLVMAPATMTISTLHYVAGVLNQLDTTPSSFASPMVEPGVNLGDYDIDLKNGSFALQFTSTGPRLTYRLCVPGKVCEEAANNPDFPPDFRISRVPEPASLALGALALVGLAVTRRRRRAG